MFDQGLRSPNRSSGDLNATLKQQLYENKLLASDNQIKTQQLDVLKEKIRELEDATNIYKKQLNNMEEKLRFSDQELKLKVQSSSDKSTTLSKDNQYLHKKNQQLQGIIKELEDKVKSLELENSRSNKDAEITRRKVVELEEQLDRARDKKRKTVGEIERISEAHKHATAENQDLSSSVERLTQENRRLLKVIDENEVQLKKLVNIQQEYCELKLKYDNEFTESVALKQSYETLKQKYDEVYYNYNVSLANKRNDDSGSRSHTSLRVTELEQELKHLEAIISQKEREIMGLNETLRDYERQNKGEDIKFETDVKRIVNLIDGHTTTFEYTDEIESVALRLLMDNILRQNKEVAVLNDKLKGSSQDIKELKQGINKLNEEKSVLRNANDELVKENNVLKSRIQFTVNDSIQNVNVAQSKFEERLQDMMAVQRDMEENFNQQLNQKDREIAYFKEMLDGTSLQLRKIEEDRDQTLGFLKEQETEIKDFKNKFFHIAEETNQQQGKLNTTSYVLTSFLKILFNLMFKVEGLVQQKAFLVPYLNQYEKVYKRLAEMQLLPPKTQPQKKKHNIYRRFRRVILAISAVIKLRKLQQKNGGGNYDEFDVRLNLPDCSESLKRFLISLFRRGKFAVHRDLVASVGDVLKQVGRHSEDAIVSKLLDAASKHNEIEYEPPTKGKKKVMKEIQLSDLTSNFKIRDDFNSKLISLDGKLRDAEEYMLKQEQEFRTEVSVLSQKLREVNEEKENYRKEKDRLQGDYQKAKEQIDALLTTVDENQTILPASERKNRTLNEDYNILQSYVSTVVKKFDTAKKELEGKNMRIIELERQALYAGYPENNFVQSTPIASASKERFGKVPGRIFSSGRKKDEFSLFGNRTAKKERDHKFFS